MQAEIRWKSGVSFDAVSGSGHTITTDGPPDAGGENAGPRPMELVLMGVGACSAYDVVHILRKQRADVTACTAQLQAERADEPPRVFTRVNLHFVVTGRGLSAHKVERAVRLSADNYCSASIMLARGGVEITHSVEIREAG